MSSFEQAAPMGMRERKKQATKEALHQAALRLSLEHGVANVTVEQIADAAGVVTRTFFNHFSCKEEAVVSAHVSERDGLSALIRGRPAEEPLPMAIRAALTTVLERLSAGLRELNPAEREQRMSALRLVSTSPELLPYAVAAESAYERELTSALAERTRDNPAITELDCELFAAWLILGRRVVLADWLNSAEQPDAEGLSRRAYHVLERVLAGFD